MDEIQGHSYNLQEWLTNKDHSKSKMCTSLQGHKGTQGNF